jgi:hypothetical protein
LERVTSNPGQTNQTLEFLGVFNAPRSGTLNSFSYVPLVDVQGRLVALPRSGTNTFRLTALGANNDLVLNFMLLVPGVAAPTEPLVSVSPPPNAVGVTANASVQAAIYDGSTPVSESSVKLYVGASQVAATATKAGSITSVKYTPSTIWAPNTTFELGLTFNDGSARSNHWSFTTAIYPVLTPAMKVTNAAVRGFVWRIHQNETNTEASIQKALNALSGQLGLQNLADPNSMGPASGPGTPAQPGLGLMTFTIPTVINVGQDTLGNFGSFTPDEQMPGIPGLNLSNDGIAVEINTFIELPQGLITMGVNSDDGFRTTAGFLNATPLVLDFLDGSRSSADSIFQFATMEAGVYAFRTIYYEGGGNASIEWFMVKPDGSRVLINDTANGGPAAYQQGTIPPAPNPTITATLNGSGQVVLQWTTGTLLSADNVNGPYTNVTGATSPHPVNPAASPRKFYRLQVQ